MKITHISILMTLVSTATALQLAHADWQGDMHLTTPGRGGASQPMSMDGKVFGRTGALRLDVDSPHGKMSIISDWKQRKVWNLMHSQKMVMETSMDRVGIDMPRCADSNYDSCLSKEGFKKTSSDSVNGHPCAVYEKDRTLGTAGSTVHVKLWRPTDLNEVPIVRSSSQKAGGGTSQFDITNVATVASLDSALFAPPSDYKQMAGMGGGGGARPGLPPNAQKMSPEQLQQLRQQMLKQYGGGQ